MAGATGLRWKLFAVSDRPFRLPAYRVSGRGLPPLNPLTELAHCL